MGVRAALVLVSVLLAACGAGNDSSTPPAISIDGTWAASHQPTGSGLVLTLGTRIGVDTPDTLVVNGSGTYAIEAGRFNHEEDALKEALSLWEERERQRAEFLASLNDANGSLARGEGRSDTVEMLANLVDADGVLRVVGLNLDGAAIDLE